MPSSPLSGGYPSCQPSGLFAARTGRARSAMTALSASLSPLTEARKVAGTRAASSGHPPRTIVAPAPDIRGIIREVIREIAAAAPPDDRDDDDSDAMRTLQCVVEERDRTIAAHEATIRDLRQRLDAEVEERRRVQERLTALLTHRQTGSVPPVQRPATTVSTSRVPWWKRWFR